MQQFSEIGGGSVSWMPPERRGARHASSHSFRTKASANRSEPDVAHWHECDIARSQMDGRFRGKSGRAADITGTTEFDPGPDYQPVRGTSQARSCFCPANRQNIERLPIAETSVCKVSALIAARRSMRHRLAMSK